MELAQDTLKIFEYTITRGDQKVKQVLLLDKNTGEIIQKPGTETPGK